MKKLLLMALILPIVIASASFALDRAPLYGVVSGSVLGANNFTTLSGALQIGANVSIDASKGLSLRTLYTKAHWGDLEFTATTVTPMLSWYAGSKWDFYVMLGRQSWELDDESGTDYFLGFGTSRRLYTANGDEWAVPFTVDGFVDFTTDNKGDVYDNVGQLTFGFQFSKPIRKK